MRMSCSYKRWKLIHRARLIRLPLALSLLASFAVPAWAAQEFYIGEPVVTDDSLTSA